MVNAEYEYVALHRDVGETELERGWEIRDGGKLVYVDSATVRAVKVGRILEFWQHEVGIWMWCGFCSITGPM